MRPLNDTIAHCAVRIACLFLPRRKRREVRTWYKWNYCGINTEWADAVRKKARSVKLVMGRIQTLALGSSHGEAGFVPDESSFNLCGASQDLYTSASMYRQCAGFPNLKTVILFYSVFSSGCELEKTGERERCVYYKHLWGVPYRYYDEASWANKEESFLQWDRSREFKPDIGYRGLCDYSTFPMMSTSVEERVASHLKNNRRNNGQVAYVESMIDLADKSGHRFVVVIPPCRNDYTRLCPPYKELFAELLAVLERHSNVSLLSFWGDQSFADSDFGDTDHLNLVGARKRTSKINASLSMHAHHLPADGNGNSEEIEKNGKGLQ